MKKYCVYYTSKNLHSYEIAAETPEEAKELAALRVANCDEGDEEDTVFDEPFEFWNIEEMDDSAVKHNASEDQEEEMIRFRTAEQIKHLFKKHCVKENVSMTMILEKLLINYMKDHALLDRP